MDKLRRKLIGNVVSAPIWIPPAVTAVSLPAHAQTSNGIVFSYENPNALPIPISVVVQGTNATIKIRQFFDGGCDICGSDVEYEGKTDIFGAQASLVAVDYGCGVSAPEILGTVSIDSYSSESPSITVSIFSTVMSNSVVVIPRGNNPDLGAFSCS